MGWILRTSFKKTGSHFDKFWNNLKFPLQNFFLNLIFGKKIYLKLFFDQKIFFRWHRIQKISNFIRTKNFLLKIFLTKISFYMILNLKIAKNSFLTTRNLQNGQKHTRTPLKYIESNILIMYQVSFSDKIFGQNTFLGKKFSLSKFTNKKIRKMIRQYSKV